MLLLFFDIKSIWYCINAKTDDNMKRILRNNKSIVENTMNNNMVKPNNELIEKHSNLKPGTKKHNYRVTLP